MPCAVLCCVGGTKAAGNHPPVLVTQLEAKRICRFVPRNVTVDAVQRVGVGGVRRCLVLFYVAWAAPRQQETTRQSLSLSSRRRGTTTQVCAQSHFCDLPAWGAVSRQSGFWKRVCLS